jgi:O-antigen/teichoic acid export membrane protein
MFSGSAMDIRRAYSRGVSGMHRLWECYARKGGFAANVLVLFSWVVAAQAITFVVMPILTRLYRPDQFGLYSLFTSASAMIGVVAALRYEYAIVLPEKDAEARSIVWLGLTLAAVAGGLTWVIGSVAGGLLGPESEVAALRPWLVWLGGAVFLTAAYSTFMYWALRKKEFGSLARSRVVIAVAMVGVQLSAALVFGPYTALLIAAMLVGQAAGVVFLAWSTHFRITRPSPMASVRHAAVRYASFPKYSALGSLLDGMSSLIPVAMLTILFSPTIAGFYAVADKVVRTPSVLLGSSLQQVFYQRLAESRNDPATSRSLVLMAWRYLSLIGIGPMLLLFLFGPGLFGFVFGAAWREAGMFARILTVGLMFHFVAYPTANGIVAFERLGIMLSWQVLYIGSLLTVFGVGGFVLRLSPRDLMWWFAASQAVVQVANLGAQWKVLVEHNPLSVAPVLAGTADPLT